MAGTPDYIDLTINNYPLTDLSVTGEGISLGISDADTDGSSYYRFYFEYTDATTVELTISAKGYQTQTFTATVGMVDNVTLIPSYIDNIQTEDGTVYKLRTKTSELENDSGFLTEMPSDIDYVIETYNDGTNWYRVYKSGWVVQGGYTTGATTQTITFLKPFATETPTVICTGRTGNIVVHTTELSSTTFKWHDSATPESVGVFWRAEGQGA